jgi:hypothetical protein
MRNFQARVPGAAQRKTVRCRPGTPVCRKETETPRLRRIAGVLRRAQGTQTECA